MLVRIYKLKETGSPITARIVNRKEVMKVIELRNVNMVYAITFFVLIALKYLLLCCITIC